MPLLMGIPRFTKSARRSSANRSQTNYPIEVGSAEVLPDGSLQSRAILIRPDRDWTDWSAEAESIHGKKGLS